MRSHKLPHALADAPCYKLFPGRANASKTSQIFLANNIECILWGSAKVIISLGYENISKFFGAHFPDGTSKSVIGWQINL